MSHNENTSRNVINILAFSARGIRLTAGDGGRSTPGNTKRNPNVS